AGDDEDVDRVAPREVEREQAVEDVHARASIAFSTLRKSTVSRTSCTRTIAALPRFAAATAASDPGTRAGPAGCPVKCPMNALRDAPITTGAIAPSFAQCASSSR